MLCVSSAPSMTPAFIRRSIEWHPPCCIGSATIAGLRGRPLPCSPQRLEIVRPLEGGESTATPFKPLAGHSLLQRSHVVARLPMLLHGSQGCRLVFQTFCQGTVVTAMLCRASPHLVTSVLLLSNNAQHTLPSYCRYRGGAIHASCSPWHDHCGHHSCCRNP